MATQKIKPLTKAILETAEGLHRVGIMDDTSYDKITLRHLGKQAAAAAPISGAEIRQVREQARLSQAVFARCLNVTTGYVSQLERGTKQPSGSMLALLNVIRRKGIAVVL